jgi:hypothetical protein
VSKLAVAAKEAMKSFRVGSRKRQVTGIIRRLATTTLRGLYSHPERIAMYHRLQASTLRPVSNASKDNDPAFFQSALDNNQKYARLPIPELLRLPSNAFSRTTPLLRRICLGRDANWKNID